MITPAQHKFIIQCSEYAEKAHKGQFRKNGGPFILHPARVASLVVMSGVGSCEAICAAWLHDVIEDCCEDTLFSLYTIKHNQRTLNDFLDNNTSQDGNLILKLIEALTFPEDEEKMKDQQKTEYYERMRDNDPLCASTIKFCDRIDNLSTVDCFSKKDIEIYISDTEKMFNILGSKVVRQSSVIYELFRSTLIEAKEKYK
jgi:(p)ppGpp synthase/HD superfamily hydrolase